MFMVVVNWFAWTEKETSLVGLILLKSDRDNYGLRDGWLLLRGGFRFPSNIRNKSHHSPHLRRPLLPLPDAAL